MKSKILLLILVVLALFGCTNLNKLNYDDIVNHLSIKEKNANTYKMGYKYYMPKGLYQYDSGANYAILASDDNYYYLYFDLLSYLNKEKITYTAKEELYYSKAISYEDKLGYVEITKKENDKYLIEIMYNYAKIEVIVDEDEIKSSLANTINILNSIKYNKNVITKLLEEDSLTSTEEVYKLFDKVKKNSDILDYVEGINVSDEDVIKDTDFID